MTSFLKFVECCKGCKRHGSLQAVLALKNVFCAVVVVFIGLEFPQARRPRRSCSLACSTSALGIICSVRSAADRRVAPDGSPGPIHGCPTTIAAPRTRADVSLVAAVDPLVHTDRYNDLSPSPRHPDDADHLPWAAPSFADLLQRAQKSPSQWQWRTNTSAFTGVGHDRAVCDRSTQAKATPSFKLRSETSIRALAFSCWGYLSVLSS